MLDNLVTHVGDWMIDWRVPISACAGALVGWVWGHDHGVHYMIKIYNSMLEKEKQMNDNNTTVVQVPPVEGQPETIDTPAPVVRADESQPTQLQDTTQEEVKEKIVL
jgi:hypothetical protein